MQKTIFYLVRHGESEWNVKGLLQGQSSVHNPLTAKGIQQAKDIAKELSTVKFDVIIASDLQRTIETATIIAQHLEAPLQSTHHLREVSHGEYEGTKGEDYLKLFIRWNNLTDEERHTYTVSPNVETNKHAIERVSDFIKTTAKDYPAQTILMVMHSGLMRYLAISLGHGTYDSIPGFENTGYIKLESDGKTITILEMKRIRKG